MSKDEVGAYARSFDKVTAEYSSQASDWVGFLSCWRGAVERRLSKERGWSGLERLPPHVNVLGDVASNSAIRTTIGAVTLPLSYQHFLMATRQKGWFVESVGSIDKDGNVSGGLLEVGQIGVFAEVDPVTYKTWVDNSPSGQPIPGNYYSYGYLKDRELRQNSAHMRVEHLRHAIKIGQLDQGGVILLNPSEVTADGEMETWTLSFRTHVVRYRSFAELMQDLAYIDAAPATAQSAIHEPGVYDKAPCVRLLRTAATKP